MTDSDLETEEKLDKLIIEGTDAIQAGRQLFQREEGNDILMNDETGHLKRDITDAATTEEVPSGIRKSNRSSLKRATLKRAPGSEK